MTLQQDIDSMLVTALSGSAGAIVASRNQHGPYFRARTAPTGLPTIRQIRARDALSQSAALWQTITPVQRAAWESYATASRNTHRSSTDRALLGRHHFLRCNALRYRLPAITGPWQISDAPLDTVEPALHVTAVQSLTRSGTVRVWFDTADDWNSDPASALFLYASPPLPPAVRFHLAPMRLASWFFGYVFGPPRSPHDFAYPYAATVADEPVNVFFRLSHSDGRLSRKHRFRAQPP